MKINISLIWKECKQLWNICGIASGIQEKEDKVGVATFVTCSWQGRLEEIG